MTMVIEVTIKLRPGNTAGWRTHSLFITAYFGPFGQVRRQDFRAAEVPADSQAT
jgi:hypothetical protein